jgi:adenylate cyclase
MATLHIIENGLLRKVELDGDAVLGRGEGSSVRLADQSASKSHARLVRDGKDWRLVDLGSRNGTYVNGQRVQDIRLKPGDRVQIGTTVITVEDRQAGRVRIDEEDEDEKEGGTPIMAAMAVDAGGPTAAVAGNRLQPGRPPLPRKPTSDNLAEKKLQLIKLVNEKILQILDNNQLMEEILALVVQQTKADRGYLCLLDDSGAPVPIAAHGLRSNKEMHISRTVLRRLLDEKSGVLIKEVGEGDAMQSLAALRVTSTIYVPLWTSNRIIGFLSLDSLAAERSFTENDLDLLLTVAHQAAVGIERGRLAQQAAQAEKDRAYLCQYLDDKIIKQMAGSADGQDALAPRETEVTVLFSDIVSFTKMSEGLPPRDLAMFVRDYLSAMTEIIFQHGGTIDKYIGDAVMALFGAPVAIPDAAASAVRAALAMRGVLQNLRPPRLNMGPLRVRFGINTGRAVVGNIGSSRRVEYTAIGDAVNVASRLQTFARPNEICIDELTHERVGELFQYEEIGSIDVKNRSEPIRVYKVIEEKTDIDATLSRKPVA